MRGTRKAGFTLVEIMIAIAIIILLAAVLLVTFTGAFSKSKAAQTKVTIETLGSNIKTFESAWGIPPPATLRDLGALGNYPALADPNPSNVGIEALVLSLRSKRERGPYLDEALFQDDTRRTNLDMDMALEAALGPQFLDIEAGTSRDLFEITDAWGNPLVYLDVKTLMLGTYAYEVTMADGTVTKLDPTACADAMRHPVTGQLPTGYVLWSFGEDGINQYGRGDDIVSWGKYEDP